MGTPNVSIIQLRIECAWCGALVQAGHEPTSHGICDSCKAVHFRATPKPAAARVILDLASTLSAHADDLSAQALNPHDRDEVLMKLDAILRTVEEARAEYEGAAIGSRLS
jgi:hypothetical protein